MSWIVFSTCLVVFIGTTIVLRVNRMDKREIIYGGRIFEIYCGSDCGGRMCSVSIYEVIHPNRKIFRMKYRDTKYFWVEDYGTIKEGIFAMIESYIEDETEQDKINKKWGEMK